MKDIKQITSEIFESMPSNTRFSAADAALIKKHKDILLGLEDELAKGFYDTLYDHPSTFEILKQEDRSKRENVLRSWWQKTVNSDFDNAYWEWQVFVGLIHIKQKVSNPMMIAMWGWILTTLRRQLSAHLDQAELDEIMISFERLAATIQSLTAESFLSNYVQAIEQATGFNNKLIDRMVNLQIDDLISQKA
ncbi:protoglobin domain-containing protein [Methylomarinum sp. Ch1-1]|uniref:Protoglobin domain-containing protein n=1 Tax=Methylomarinum roseum TaxID=3067653 RepID=A0AAU7NYH2_9GAMM|nr:protoglobin domain-containing protein [Methylomarinum sp. Ch1-1]MDP4521872.1 protoglobin domain-containing protein [Methylomarinum sp. Ch1-1]